MEFLLHDKCFEALYGGAAGGGKSGALLMAAAQYVDVPGYAALLLRETFRDLNQPDALIPRSKEWWQGTRAQWSSQDKRWTFPSGATITFGYLEHEDDIYQYQGSAYSFVGYDELTQFSEARYTYLASRVRKLATGAIVSVPLRLRSATNPGGAGHDWVRKRFIPDEFFKVPETERFSRPWYHERRVFVPARLEDNPSLDKAEYERGLALLDPVTRAQLRRGDWQAHAGGRFNPRWWRRYRTDLDIWHLDSGNTVNRNLTPRIVIVDPANRTTKTSKYTAIGVFGDGGDQRLLVLDMVREQLSLEEIVPAIESVCRKWAPVAWVGIEANGFQMHLVNEARKRAAIPTVYELQPEGKSKLTRATPAILRAEQGLIYLPEAAPWVTAFESELGHFTGDEKQDAYTDQVDTLAYSVNGFDRIGTGGDGSPMILT